MTVFWICLGVAGWFALGYWGYRMELATWTKMFGSVSNDDRRSFRQLILLGVSNLLAALLWR